MSALFRKLAVKLFRVDQPPSARLSHVLGVRQRAVQYWLSGQHEAPSDVIESMEKQVSAIDEIDLERRIESIVNDAARVGMHPSVTAYFFDRAVEKLKDQGNNS